MPILKNFRTVRGNLDKKILTVFNSGETIHVDNPSRLRDAYINLRYDEELDKYIVLSWLVNLSPEK